MSMSKEILTAIKASIVVAEAEIEVTKGKMQAAVAEAAKQVIANIPALIATAVLNKQDHVNVLQVGAIGKALGPGEAYGVEWPSHLRWFETTGLFLFPTWKDNMFASKPKPEWLSAMARIVWDYCVENGLQPIFAPFSLCGRTLCGTRQSRIVICFDPRHIQNLLSKLG